MVSVEGRSDGSERENEAVWCGGSKDARVAAWESAEGVREGRLQSSG
jgi:hypothetical protein